MENTNMPIEQFHLVSGMNVETIYGPGVYEKEIGRPGTAYDVWIRFAEGFSLPMRLSEVHSYRPPPELEQPPQESP